MGRIFKALILAAIFAALNASAQFLPDESPTPDRRQKMIEKLQKCIAECLPDEAKLAERMLALTNAIADKSVNLNDQIPAIVSLYGDMIDFYEEKNDVANLVSTYAAVLFFVPTLRESGVDEQAFMDKVNAGVERLPEKYPTNARVFALLGVYRILNHASKDAIVEAYRQCIVLDPGNQGCRKAYESSVQVYTLPRCVGSDLSAHSFGLFLGSMTKADGLVETKTKDGRVLYLERSPAVDASDIESVFQAKGEFGQDELSIQLTAEGRNKIAEITHDNVGKSLALMIDQSVLSAPIIRGQIKTDRLVVNVWSNREDGQTLFTQVCPHPITPELPANLKLP